MLKRIIFFGFMAMLLGCETDFADQELSEGDVIGELAATESGIKYTDYNAPEAISWGPSGIFAIRDGYAIPDNTSKKIVVVDENFTIIDEFSMREAMGITAVVQNNFGIIALDNIANTPKLFQINLSGSTKSISIPKSHETPPSGLTQDDDGVILEYGGGENLYRVTSDFQITPIDGYMLNGQLCYVEKATKTYFHERNLHIGDKTVAIRVPNHLGAVQILGLNKNGEIQVLVEDVELDPIVSVEQTVWSISSAGKILSVSQVPLEEMDFSTDHPVTLNKKGEPVVMVPKKDGLQFWALNKANPDIMISKSIRHLPNEIRLPDQNIGIIRQGLIVYNGSCLTPLQMLININEYRNTTAYLESVNIDNSSSCSGRTKPAYLGGPGTYLSVSYDWGGFDTPSAFVSAMSIGKKAGNLNTSYSLSCSYGVDCSGFVSRVWGFTYKLSTSTIPSHVKPYTPTLTLGDVLNKVGTHVVIFGANASNGIYAYESTHYNNYDRVVYTYRPWSTLSGYQALRSETSCL